MEKNKSTTTENIISIIVGISVVVILIIVFGWTSVKTWVMEPLKWRIPEGVDINFTASLPDTQSDNEVKMFFDVFNSTGKEIDEYYIRVAFGNSEINFGVTVPDIKEYGSTDIVKTVRGEGYSFSGNDIDHEDFLKLKNNEFSNEDMTYKIEYMYSHGDKLIKNSGWKKNLLILAISVAFGLLGFSDVIKISIFRIIFKILGTPGVLIVFAIMFVFMAARGSSASSSQSSKEALDDSVRKRANERYKRAAQQKAGYEMHGNTREAARAQREMDEAMADIIAGSGSYETKARYKRYASWEAGAKMTGNEREAAKSRAAKEQALADIITETTKNK